MTGGHRDDPEISLRCLETLSCYLKIPVRQSFRYFFFLSFAENFENLYIFYAIFSSWIRAKEFQVNRGGIINIDGKPVAASLNCSLELKRGNLKRFALKGRGTLQLPSRVPVFKVKEGTLAGRIRFVNESRVTSIC